MVRAFAGKFGHYNCIKNYELKFFYYIFLLLFSSYLHSQTSLTNKELENINYSYKQILNKFETQFIALSEGKGTGLPAVLIDTTVMWDKRDKTKKGLIRFGDVPVYQGFYLAVLATDYELNNKVDNSFLDKMYFVLKSKERLDIFAEIQLHNQKKISSPNGFFIRDDIDEKTSRKLFKQSFLHSDTKSLDNKLKNSMSQDQVIGWLMGYCFVINVLKKSNSNKEKEILAMAKSQMKTLLKFMSDNNWIIRDTINKKLVPRGPVAKLQAFPMVEIGKKYLGIKFDTPITEGFGKLSWKLSEIGFKWGRRVTIADVFNDKKRYLIYGDINNSMMLKLAALSNTWKDKRLSFASEMSNLEIYELINAYLFERNPLIDIIKIENILKTITPKGAYYYGNHYKAKGAWASRDRWSHPADIYEGNDRFIGHYPGLDFLLMRNLYLLTYKNAR